MNEYWYYTKIFSLLNFKVLVAYQNIYGGSTINVGGFKMFEDVIYIEETKVTVRKYRHRTTIPAKIFRLLKLKDGDILRWIAMKDGKIFIEKKSTK